MKLLFISMTLLIVAMFIIPVGGMCESNVNHELYINVFLGCEILCIISIIRLTFKFKGK